VPLLVYSVLRLALFGACWVALVALGLNPWISVVAAALVAWGLSYVALRGPRDAAARWLADQDAKRKGTTQLSARARRDAADEDALVASQDEGAVEGPAPDGQESDGTRAAPSSGAADPGPGDTGPADPVPDGARPEEPARDRGRPDPDRRV
jgi:hypothetical protein